MTILERLRAATGPDRELDVAIVTALCPDAIVQIYITGDDEKSVFHAQSIGIANKSYTPRYTASIDAALALVERMLPGSGYMITRGRATFYEPMFGVELYHMDLIPDDGEPIPYDWPSESNSLPLAILTALFTALEAKEKVKSP